MAPRSSKPTTSTPSTKPNTSNTNNKSPIKKRPPTKPTPRRTAAARPRRQVQPSLSTAGSVSPTATQDILPQVQQQHLPSTVTQTHTTAQTTFPAGQSSHEMSIPMNMPSALETPTPGLYIFFP
ncbi:hypothetical protein DL98DRAFT_516471 [Cadophora sp. DSE1049]|nr:hypothetical protein DL98DRAFT_516471 [Cadophora sp. DSE1049]